MDGVQNCSSFLMKTNKETNSTAPSSMKACNSFCYNRLKNSKSFSYNRLCYNRHSHNKTVDVAPVAHGRAVAVVMNGDGAHKNPLPPT